MGTGWNATMLLTYGPDGCYQVEFRLDEDGDLVGRYMPDARGKASEWSKRGDFGYPATAALIQKIKVVLSHFSLEGVGENA